jgi:hypothetical protein
VTIFSILNDKNGHFYNHITHTFETVQAATQENGGPIQHQLPHKKNTHTMPIFSIQNGKNFLCNKSTK